MGKKLDSAGLGEKKLGELQNVPSGVVLGRGSAGVGAVEQLPCVNPSGFSIGENAPTGIEVGHRWTHTTSGITYTYVYDGNSYQWVELAGGATSPEVPGVPVFVQETSPGLSTPHIWFQTGLGAAGNDFTLWIDDGS